MIIAIDGYEANVQNRVGIGRYAFEILTHLHEIVDVSRHSVRIYLPSSPLPDMPKATAGWKYRVIGPRKFWTFIGFPKALFWDKPAANVIFSPTHYAPRFVHIPSVISIMDLSYLYFPEMFRVKDLHQLVHWSAYSIRHASKILTISESTKHAIMEAYKVPEHRIIVTYPGFTKLSMVEGDVIKKYQLPPRYILSVGTIQPRKNYVRLMEAFAQAAKTLASHYPDITLVIVGKKGWLYEKILEAPQKWGISEKVKFLDFVPDKDLPDLYKHALCFALPSLYEGFGLPVLEAMAYGCPVVVSNVSSLPEIAEKAGVYVDPQDVESIAQGLVKVAEEKNKKSGKDRIAIGLAQVKKFSWEKAAKQTLEVLEEVGKGKV